jgi:transcriptional regulator with XRE-family HTH domain
VEPHQRLKEARDAKGLSLESMGALLDCSASHLSLLEDGKRKPGLALAFRIQDVLGIRAQSWIVEAA